MTDVDLTAWAIRFDVLLTRELRPVAAARLRRARSWRSGAMAVGVLIGGLPLVVTAIAPAAASSFNTPATSMAWLTAAAIGALVAEATVAQRPQRPGRAVMIRRSTSDYVSIRWIRLVVGSVPVAVVLAEGNDRAHQLALRIRALLELRLRHTVTADEVTYLTMHIARMELGMRTRN